MSLLCLFITIERCVIHLANMTQNFVFYKHVIFISTWLTSELASFVFVSVTAFKMFTGEKIFAYLHLCPLHATK